MAPTFANLLQVLGGRDIYSWRTKRVHNTVGLLNLIGSEDARARYDNNYPNGLQQGGALKSTKRAKPEIDNLDIELFKSIWQTQCHVSGAEVFLDVGKVYLDLSAVLDKYPEITLGFGIWIKISENKKKYLDAYEAQSRKRKRDNDSDDPYDFMKPIQKDEKKPLLQIQHDLLKSRSLSDLLALSRMDGYIQLGDLNLSWTYGHRPNQKFNCENNGDEAQTKDETQNVDEDDRSRDRDEEDGDEEERNVGDGDNQGEDQELDSSELDDDDLDNRNDYPNSINNYDMTMDLNEHRKTNRNIKTYTKHPIKKRKFKSRHQIVINFPSN